MFGRIVLSSNGKKLGLTSSWGIVLQELNRNPVPAPHVLDAQRISAERIDAVGRVRAAVERAAVARILVVIEHELLVQALFGHIAPLTRAVCARARSPR